MKPGDLVKLVSDFYWMSLTVDFSSPMKRLGTKIDRGQLAVVLSASTDATRSERSVRVMLTNGQIGFTSRTCWGPT